MGYNVSGIVGKVLRVANATKGEKDDVEALERGLVTLHENLMAQVTALTGKSISCWGVRK